MTMLAEAHERAEPELVDVAAMWLDMITDGCGLIYAPFETECAQRVLKQLVLADPRPTPGAVPCVPLCRLTTNTHSTQAFISRVWWPKSAQRRYSIARPHC